MVWRRKSEPLSKRPEQLETISDALIATVCGRLAANRRVRRALPRGGRLHIDRQLPFLCVYRDPPDTDDPGTRDLVKSEASYLIASGDAHLRKGLSRLIEQIVDTLGQEFGAFLIVEIWAAPDGGKSNDPRAPEVSPRFGVFASKRSALSRTVEVLTGGLNKIKVMKQTVAVDVQRQVKVAPPELPPLLSRQRARELNCSIVGISVPPVYRDTRTGQDYPLLLRTMRRRFGLALRRSVFEFVDRQTTHSPPHYHSLGRRAVVKSLWVIDEQLAAVSNTFDFLLQVTPINSDAAWREFKSSHFQREPDFHYLPTPMDPAVLKRQLYAIPIERLEDPALHHLFQEKQDELDRKITMLRDRNTPGFLYGSLQLYGPISDHLFELAKQILDETSSRSRESAKGKSVTPDEFARHAETEFSYYRQQHDGFTAKTSVSSKVAGLMVSRGRLLINDRVTFPASRVNALIQHEVGTHLLTYFNGRAQPFRQLYSGLAGYDELQEGLAVLAEYLVGGLSRPRIRQLAARVIAARMVSEGATFVETFRALDHNFDFAQRAAYSITMRVYRGGGFTKDAVYLRGLQTMLKYVAKNGNLEPLFVGKLAAEHIPLVRELQFRKVLCEPPLKPRYMEDVDALQRLEGLRQGATVLDLLKRSNS
jgi:uncharacterized protein (TIGR02421 family)